MLQRINSNLESGSMIRILADAILVNLALLAALGLHLFYRTSLASEVIPMSLAWSELLTAYLSTFVILTSISINVFYLSGFYSRSRHYQHQYKRRKVLQAVTVAQLVFALVIFLLWDNLNFPRSALLPAWALTSVALVAARMFAYKVPAVNQLDERFSIPTQEEQALQKVLVIGGGGYIGSALLEKLLAKGYQVRLLDLLLFGKEPLQKVIDHPNLEIIRDDFRQVHAVLTAMRDMDSVIHLGAIVGDPACAYDEKLTIDTNLMATRMIAEVAQCIGIKRLIFASTCSVYGASDEILDERSTLNPVSLYARSKIASEEILTAMANDNFSPVFMRFGTIYGLSGRTRFDLVINLLTAKAIFDKKITIFGGDQWRPFVHVEDAAEAVSLALEAPKSVVHNRIFNVGSNGQNYTINQIGDLIQQALPDADVVQMGQDGDKRNYQVDFSRIRNELNFTPQWTVEQGIEQVESAINEGFVTDYQAAKYCNFKYLKERGVALLDDTVAQEHQSETAQSATVQLAYNMNFPLGTNNWTSELVQPLDEVIEAVDDGSQPDDRSNGLPVQLPEQAGVPVPA